jgi:hypothetical protein
MKRNGIITKLIEIFQNKTKDGELKEYCSAIIIGFLFKAYPLPIEYN